MKEVTTHDISVIDGKNMKIMDDMGVQVDKKMMGINDKHYGVDVTLCMTMQMDGDTDLASWYPHRPRTERLLPHQHPPPYPSE